VNIIIPFNSIYIKKKYGANHDFINLIKDVVIPSMINRFIRDNRVESIEIISDLKPSDTIHKNKKCHFQIIDIGSNLSTNDVTKELLLVRKFQTEIVLQVNPLFPFISIDSLYHGFQSLVSGRNYSAVGSYINLSEVKNPVTIQQNDIGIFTGFTVSQFNSTFKRVSGPCEMIRLKAVEMISLRNYSDFKLFELVVNSGFEIQ